MSKIDQSQTPPDPSVRQAAGRPGATRAGAGSPYSREGVATPDLMDVFKVQQRHAAAASAYASDMLAAAAAACADVLAMRFPPGSQVSAHRNFERELLRAFRASYARLDETWNDPPST